VTRSVCHGDETPPCPCCGDPVFMYVPTGTQTDIDTIGSVRVCASHDGAYFHSDR